MSTLIRHNPTESRLPASRAHLTLVQILLLQLVLN
jgi:hypothetical protein